MGRTLCFGLYLALLGAILLAGDELPAWAAPLASIDCSGHDTTKIDAVCLLDHEDLSVLPSGRLVHSVRRAIRILTADGADWGITIVPYGVDSKVRDVRGWIRYPNGEVKMIKDKDTVDTGYLDDSLFTDVRKKIISLPNAGKGAFVCFEYELEQATEFPVARWMFQSSIPTRRSELTVTVPPGAELVWKATNLADYQPSKAGNSTVFVRDNLPALPDEPCAPPRLDVAEGVLLRVDLPPAGDDVPIACKSWADVARWYTQVTRDRWLTAASVRAVADQVCAGTTDPAEKIRRLCGWVQAEIRYVAIVIGMGSFVPHVSSAVCTSKYGDCKDMSFLLMHMLRSQGINAWPVLCRSRASGAVDPDFPSAGSFDHCIVAFEEPGGGRHFFDATSKGVGYPALPMSLDGAWGLLVKEDSGELVRISADQPPRLEMKVEASLGPTGTLIARVRETYSPSALPGVREEYKAMSEEERRKRWSGWLTTRIPGVQLGTLSWTNLFRPDLDLVIEYTLEARGVAKPAGSMWLLNPFFVVDINKPRLTEKERKLPISLQRYALHSRQVVELIYPATLKIEEGVEPVSLAPDFGTFTVTVDDKPGKLIVIKEFGMRDITLPISRYTDVKKFFDVVGNTEKIEILLAGK